MPALTVVDKISIAKISQFLAGNDIERSGYEGAGQDLRLPRKLYMIRKNIEWLYNLDSDDETLTVTSNYLYALCGKYTFKAQEILNTGGGGGIISPVVNTTVPIEPYDWVVGATTSDDAPLKDGDTSVTLTRFIGVATVNFVRGNLVQNTTLPPDGVSSWYSWNSVTGLFTLNNGAAGLDEQMRIFI